MGFIAFLPRFFGPLCCFFIFTLSAVYLTFTTAQRQYGKKKHKYYNNLFFIHIAPFFADCQDLSAYIFIINYFSNLRNCENAPADNSVCCP